MMMNSGGTTDCEKCCRLICLGCTGGGRKFQQMMFCQWLMMGTVLFVWIRFNGGLWPTFIKPTWNTAPDTHSDILNHFKYETQGDGLKVKWAHAVNSHEKLRDAMTDGSMMLEGDVLLRGQNTPQLQLVPVMAHPPQTDSDITLKEWLAKFKHIDKGIKLDFKSIESVDLSLQTLAELREKFEFNVPVHLSAEVVDGPNSFMAPNKYLDPARFVGQCRSHFPESTLALGWTNGWSEEGEQLYTWTMIKAMHDILESQKIQQPVTFNVRGKLAKNSVVHLRWLMEMSDGSLTLFSPVDDKLTANDILNIRHRFPKDKVFYDIDDKVKQDLAKVPHDGGIDERRKFQVSQWKAIRSKAKSGEKIYLGSEALVFQNGLLISKEEFRPKAPVTIEGRVEFINIPTADVSDSTSQVGLGIYLRVSQSSQAHIISGIRCFISFSGHLEISTQSVPGVDLKAATAVPGTLPCFKYKIIDDDNYEKITAEVTRLKTCNDAVPETEDENKAKLEFSMRGINIDSYYLGLRAPSTQAFVVVDEFRVH